MGRLERQKRPDLALEVVARLRGHGSEGEVSGTGAGTGKGPPIRLRLCGEGSLRPRIERRVAALGLGDAVELAGFLDRPSTAMADADLLLSTSDFEGLPNALIEAQGLGLPVVATRCPFGPDEIVEDGVTGLLVPVGDVEALAGAVAALARDPERRLRMAAAGRARARERFGADAVIPRWEAAIEQVVAGREPPEPSGRDRPGEVD
jgi:glycosyltransferase involved in cell wall biosynthesis